MICSVVSRVLAGVMVVTVGFSAPAAEFAHVEAHHHADHGTDAHSHSGSLAGLGLGTIGSDARGDHPHDQIGAGTGVRVAPGCTALPARRQILTLPGASRDADTPRLRATPPRAGPEDLTPTRPRAPPFA